MSERMIGKPSVIRRAAPAAGVMALLAGALLLPAGCQTAPVPGVPLTHAIEGNGVEAQMEFWHALPERRLVTNDEAFHALLLFIDGEDPSADYFERIAALEARQMLPRDFAEQADAPARRGTVAVAVARALEIKGGVVMRLVGPTPRYASRELQYLNIYPAISPQQTFTGPDLVELIARMEDYQRSRPSADPGPGQAAQAGGGGAAAVPRHR